MAVQKSTVVFPFSDESKGTLRLENGGPLVGFGYVPVKLFAEMPPEGLSESPRFSDDKVYLFASEGTIEFAGKTDTDTIKAAIHTINYASSLTLDNLASVEILLAFDHDGEPIPISTGFPFEVGGVRVVSHTFNEVKFSRPFYGLVKSSEYQKPYTVLRYKPKSTGRASIIDPLLSYSFGVIAAYRNGTMATLEVEPFDAAPGDDQIEVYRIESSIVINKEGAWEMPDGWPDNPSYPNGAEAPRARSGIVSTRVHEAGYVTLAGSVYTRAFSVTIEKPYWGVVGYVPKKVIVQGSGLSSLSPEMRVKAEEALEARKKGKL